jgi:hypothetical protein
MYGASTINTLLASVIWDYHWKNIFSSSAYHMHLHSPIIVLKTSFLSNAVKYLTIYNG